MSAQSEWRGEILQLSWKPRAYHLKNFLTDAECEHIKHIVSSSGYGLFVFLLSCYVPRVRSFSFTGGAEARALPGSPQQFV
jgi:hypothetical protein